MSREEQKVLEQEPITKNNLEVDLISRADAIHAVSEALKRTFVEYEDVANYIIGKVPSVTPQEPFKPMAEIDLYSVIKQKYIERDVLDKIREPFKRCGNHARGFS